jgi:transcription antitermination factor NusG
MSVWQVATEQGFESYYPHVTIRPVNPRAQKTAPYFPGYLFVRADIDQTGTNLFRWMTNALGLVSFDDTPAPLDDHLIEAIREHMALVAKSGGSDMLAGLKQGDEVSIKAGPFAGYRAIFDTRLPGKDRVRVLLTLLSDRSVPVVLDAGQIKPS